MNRKNTEPGSRHVTGFLVGALVVSIAVTMAAFWYTEQQTEYSLQYSADSDALRVLSPQLAKYATAAAVGNEDAFVRLKKAQVEFQDQYLALTTESTMNVPLTGQQSKEIRNGLAVLGTTWSHVQADIQSVLDKKSSVLALHGFAKTLSNLIPLLQSQYDQIVQNLLDADAPATQVQQAQEQILRTERLLSSLTQVLAGRENFAMAADNFHRDAMLFERVLNDTNESNGALDLEKISGKNILLQLNSIKAQFKAVLDVAANVIISAPDLYQIRQTADQIALGSYALLMDSTVLFKSFQAIPSNVGFFVVNNHTALAAGGVLTLLLLLLASVQVFRERRQLQQAIADHHSDNKASVTHLLKEFDQLTAGDLTINMTVRDDITGPIADAVNRAVEQLRIQFTAIDQTSIAVQKAAEDNLQTMRKLTIASEYQRREIIDVTTTMKQLALSLDGMTGSVQKSITTVEDSLTLAQRGFAAIQITMASMGDIVERANILSVNAAIKAVPDTKTGKKFAVVAEEARQLTQQISKVAQQLEGFVQEMQADAHQVAIMEQSPDRSAGELSQLEAVYQKLLLSISGIAQAARTQSLSAGDIAATMNVIREITTQTAHGANASATLTGNLAELASEMQHAVGSFKLPEVKHVKMDDVGSKGHRNSEVDREETVSEG